MGITIFSIADLLNGIGNLICTHDLTVLTKTEETTHYSESFGYDGKMFSTHVSIVLMKVIVPTEDG
jgi:hypothetical protein